jgi:rod shape-determining protein MreC
VFKPTKQQLKSCAIFFSLLILFFFFPLALKQPLINILKQPLNLVMLIQREALGVVFYHRNLVRNEALEREMDLLRNKINSLNETYLENIRLKQSLAFKQKSSLKLIPARVIARSADSWSSSIIIDKGSYHGIRPGMGVITYLGLAGRIMEVTSSTSKVMLLSDPSLGVSSLIQRSRQEGLVSGTLGNNLIMKYLPEEADMKTGDMVVTSGLNSAYPKGILIGKIIETGKEFSGLSRYAIIEPVVNFSNLEEILVVLP